MPHGADCDSRARPETWVEASQTAEFAQVFARGYGLSVEPGTRWRVHLDTTPRRMGRWLAVAVALHAPLTPLAGLVGLFRFLNTDDQEMPDLPPVTEIPLDIIEDEQEAPPKPAEPAPAAMPPERVVEPAAPKEPDAPKPEPKPKEPVDAGAPDAGAAADAGTPEDAGVPPKPGEGIGSPVAGIGDKRIADPNANVQVRVYNDRVRQHPLGARVGPMLRNVYQWRDFFGPTNIDPIKDIDRMAIIGPQLRDSRAVIAILQFNIPGDKVHAAVETLVARDSEGAWMDAGVPVAKAHADRGERYFVMPSPQILVVAPETARAAAEKLPKKFRIPGPKGDEIAIAHLKTPWRAFLGMPVVIPKSIKSADLRLSPMPDGGVMIDILAQDETEPLAQQDAQALTQALQAATSLDLGLFGAVLFGSSKKKFIERGTFEADGTKIRGEIVLTKQQLETVIELAGGLLTGRAPKPRASSSAAVPTAPAPATSAGQQ